MRRHGPRIERDLVERAGLEPASPACKAGALPFELSSHRKTEDSGRTTEDGDAMHLSSVICPPSSTWRKVKESNLRPRGRPGFRNRLHAAVHHLPMRWTGRPGAPCRRTMVRVVGF